MTWILTSEQKPEINEEVLGYWADCEMHCVCTLMRDGWWGISDASNEFRPPDYWCALPEPPLRDKVIP